MQNSQLRPVVTNTVKHSNSNYHHACSYLESALNKLKNNPIAINNLGLLFYQNIEYDFACQCFYFAIKHHDNLHYCHNNLGLTLNRFGLGEKAVEHYKKALSIKTNYHQARSNLAYALQYFGKPERSEIKQAHISINDYVFAKSNNFLDLSTRNLDPNKKIILGYVSSDFRDHAVGRFLIGIMQQHNFNNFEVHLFNNLQNKSNDGTTKLLKSLQIKWHDIHSLDTEQACKYINNINVDVLIDLAGHTKGGRPDIFANRVAPAQITYLGYPNTTGLKNMDYRIGDIHADLPEFENQNTETMLRMPFPMWNYTPWPDMPDESPSPFEENGYITFGSANNHAKLQTQWLEVWAKALSSLPNTKFKIKSRALRNPKTSADLLDFFSDRGVDNNRIIIEHYSPTKSDHWKFLSSFDIALDSYPYNGTTTSCDLLWLGVPVLTRAGNSHVSRTTTSLLCGVGLEDWIAKTDNEFIEMCRNKASDLFALKHCRQNLRLRMQSESLNNADLFIIEYENLLREAWSKTCLKLKL